MAKVSIIRCGDYDRARVFDAVKRATDLACSIKESVKPNMKVLVKPNLLSARPPEDAVDTHPEVVRAVVRLVKEAGGRVILGDSPAAGFGKNVLDVYEVSGMKKLAHEEGVDLVKFTSAKFVDGIPISRYVFDCDLVISVPKFKTHCITMITAAIKNTYGVVIGMHKAAAHSKAPREEAYTFGIFHDCGIPALMQRFGDYRDTLKIAGGDSRPPTEVEEERHGTNHATIGYLIAHSWGLSDVICQAIQRHHDLGALGDDDSFSPMARVLVAVNFLAEHLHETSLRMRDDRQWVQGEGIVLDYLGLTHGEYAELSEDVMALCT